jgi:hypothetical protein
MANRTKPLSAQALQLEQAVAALARHLSWHKWPPARQLDYLFTPGIGPELYSRVAPTDALAQLHQHCVAGRSVAERTRTRAFLLDLVGRRSVLLGRPEMAAALGAVGRYYPYRRRPLAEWQPKTKNAHTQLASLLRHLFDQYGDVPEWVVGAWGAPATSHGGVDTTRLLLHLGRGESLRSFDGLPASLTKKLEHGMRQAPAGCTYPEAYRYAQLAARGALDWFGVVLESRLGREPIGPDDEFWLGVLDLFRATPMVDPWQFGPVCDWIYFRRHVGSPAEPAQPGFSVKGRNLAAVLAHTARWHQQLTQAQRHAGLLGVPLHTAWPGLPVPDFQSPDEDGRVRITQLRSFGQLLAEGRALHHCVASYVQSCQRGRCGIFSLTIDGVRAITLEVNAQRVVVQARGRHNRPLAADERHWVGRWLDQAQLVLSKYV